MVITTDRKSTVSLLNRKEYPFGTKDLLVPGGCMRYVDEGKGKPIVFVHGNGTWSYLFRRMISRFSSTYRCIAPDHIGFGRSDRPEDFSYSLTAHTKNFRLLMDTLDLDQITLVVHDLGGPIALNYALENPDRIERLVLLNTWMWDDTASQHSVANYGLVRWIAERTHFVSRMVKGGFSDKHKFSTEFCDPLDHGDEAARDHGAWETWAQSQDAGPWLAEMWSQRQLLRDKPLKMIWGMEDMALGEKALNKWWHDFPLAEVERISDAGRYAIEERPDLVAAEVVQFVTTPAKSGFLM